MVLTTKLQSLFGGVSTNSIKKDKKSNADIASLCTNAINEVNDYWTKNQDDYDQINGKTKTAVLGNNWEDSIKQKGRIKIDCW